MQQNILIPYWFYSVQSEQLTYTKTLYDQFKSIQFLDLRLSFLEKIRSNNLTTKTLDKKAINKTIKELKNHHRKESDLFNRNINEEPLFKDKFILSHLLVQFQLEIEDTYE